MSVRQLQFDDVPPHLRHGIYGVNCYQHAVGYETPMVLSLPVKQLPGVYEVNYILPMPGDVGTIITATPDMTAQALQDKLTEGCLQDRMVVSSEDAILQNGWRKVGLYISSLQKDFHFAREKGNNIWDDKVPNRGIKTYSGLPKDIDGYKLQTIFAAPSGIVPNVTKFIERDVVISSSTGSTTIHLMKNEPSLPVGHSMLVSTTPDQEFAFLRKLKLLGAMPAWSPQLAL